MIDINSPEELQTKVVEADFALLDFWAPWCNPCQMVAPVLEKLQAANPDLVVAKVNVDEQKALAHAAGIRSIPTLLLMRKGVLVKKFMGPQSLAALQAYVDAAKRAALPVSAIRP